eukprot:5880913-Prymnesium_polylepis.1
MSGAHAAAACAEHRATHSSASGGSARRQFWRCVQGGVRSPFTLGTQHVNRGNLFRRLYLFVRGCHTPAPRMQMQRVHGLGEALPPSLERFPARRPLRCRSQRPIQPECSTPTVARESEGGALRWEGRELLVD